jgi:hypothetical protein
VSKHLLLKLLLTVLLLGSLSGCSPITFGFNFSPKQLSITQGDSDIVYVMITQSGGLNSTPVEVFLSNPPSGVVTEPIVANGGAPLIISVNDEAVPGTYMIKFGSSEVYNGNIRELELTVLPKIP